MRHLVLITTSYPLSNDGSEAAGSFVVDLAESLAERVKVTVVAPGIETNLDRSRPNLTIQRFRASRQPLSLLKAYNPLHWYAILTTLNAGRAAVLQVVQKESVDHILALWVLPSGYWAKNIARRYNIPFSTWALGSDIWSLGKIPVVKNILKRVLQESCVNFADGFQLKEDVEELSGRKCSFLPSTRKLYIPIEKKMSTKPPYRLAFLGRWHHNKGVDLLMDSLALLQESDWRRIQEVRICGGGPMETQVKKGAATLKNQGRPVVVQGYLTKGEAVELLLWADYVLIPSRIESIPVIFSDAMKCMCPVVCMPVGDLPYLVRKYQVGVLAKEKTDHFFVIALRQILEKSPQIFQTGLSQCADSFDLGNIVQVLLAQESKFI